MVKYLGVASFVYILRRLNKPFYLVSESFIMLCLPGLKPYPFFLSPSKPMDCGFIQTDEVTLGELFNKDDLKKIMDTCEREYSNESTSLLHCPIKDSEKRGNIQTEVNGKEFNCLFV